MESGVSIVRQMRTKKAPWEVYYGGAKTFVVDGTEYVAAQASGNTILYGELINFEKKETKNLRWASIWELSKIKDHQEIKIIRAALKSLKLDW